MEGVFIPSNLSVSYAQSRIENLKNILNKARQEILNLRACYSNITGQKYICICCECEKAFHDIKNLEEHNCVTRNLSRLSFDDM